MTYVKNIFDQSDEFGYILDNLEESIIICNQSIDNLDLHKKVEFINEMFREHFLFGRAKTVKRNYSVQYTREEKVNQSFL